MQIMPLVGFSPFRQRDFVTDKVKVEPDILSVIKDGFDR